MSLRLYPINVKNGEKHKQRECLKKAIIHHHFNSVFEIHNK
jgi:hypothetical protein